MEGKRTSKIVNRLEGKIVFLILYKINCGIANAEMHIKQEIMIVF